MLCELRGTALEPLAQEVGNANQIVSVNLGVFSLLIERKPTHICLNRMPIDPTKIGFEIGILVENALLASRLQDLDELRKGLFGIVELAFLDPAQKSWVEGIGSPLQQKGDI